MSESIQASWPSEAASFDEHVAHMQKGVAVIRQHLIVPEDQRFEIAYAAMTTGRGMETAVEVIGDPASGKTAFGNLLLGEENRINIAPDDVSDTLFGYINPINADQRIPGKIKNLNGEYANLFANEIGNLANVRPLLDLWDDKSVIDAAAYLTTNFPEGSDHVHEHDDALNSRIAIQLLAGDHDRATSIKIQGMNAVKRKSLAEAPVVPGVAVRRAMHEGISERYPVGEQTAERIGGFIIDMVSAINASGRVSRLDENDARLGQALYDTARAGMLIRKEKYGTGIESKHVAQIAALVIPKMIKLSQASRQEFRMTAGRLPSNKEAAIGVRRVVAREVHRTLHTPEYTREVHTQKELTGMTQQATELYAYANTVAVKPDVRGEAINIDSALYGRNDSAAEAVKERKDVRRGFFKRHKA